MLISSQLPVHLQDSLYALRNLYSVSLSQLIRWLRISVIPEYWRLTLSRPNLTKADSDRQALQGETKSSQVRFYRLILTAFYHRCPSSRGTQRRGNALPLMLLLLLMLLSLLRLFILLLMLLLATFSSSSSSWLFSYCCCCSYYYLMMTAPEQMCNKMHCHLDLANYLSPCLLSLSPISLPCQST